MNEICRACGQPLALDEAKICLSCRHLVHAGCIIQNSKLCQECWFSGLSCKKPSCFAYHSGVCLADRCHGVVDSDVLSSFLHLQRGAYTFAERKLLYRQLHRQFYSTDGALEQARDGQRKACPHSECLAYEKSICLASMCFGSIVMPKLPPVMVRAQVYDDYALRTIARRSGTSDRYTMQCSMCGGGIPCSGDAARHYLFYNKKPICRDCRNQ